MVIILKAHMAEEKIAKTPSEKLLALKHELEFEILNDTSGSTYSKYNERGYLKSIDAVLAENPSDAVKQIVYDSIQAAYTSRRMYKSARDELATVKQAMAETDPPKVIVSALSDSYERMLKSMGERFKQVYQKAKEKGQYPGQMLYFDWLWHELEVIKGSGTYLRDKAKKDLADLEKKE